MEIENSRWAMEFKNDAPLSYKDAIRIASDNSLKVWIYQSEASGEPRWIIDAGEVEPGFWLDSFLTEEECVSCCSEMGWAIEQ
ncbi:hypothetical protein [Yersinia intermedia]|uniref:hypothetical protein n=1 Tax=Yersinia intermedia TaxID=631 RepID=UPI00065D0896|nr:hypothetical protein [Yersinia intermedia]CRY84014.1 Uncharacterised protein [Yersinia intermedia]